MLVAMEQMKYEIIFRRSIFQKVIMKEKSHEKTYTL